MHTVGTMIWRTNETLLFIASIVCFLGVIEGAFQVGRRHKERSDGAAVTHLGALQTALLGLLALLLGFTFAMALARFEERKALVVEEANALGTTFLRTQFLPEPRRQEVARLLKEYVAARIAFNVEPNEQVRTTVEATSARLQQELWSHTATAAAQQPTSAPMGLLIHALNQAIDVREEIRAARDNHVPETVLVLLFSITVAALVFIGYGSGLTGLRRFLPNAVFALLIALVLTIILDLDRPRRGLIRVSQTSMIRLKAHIDQSQP
jgi:hypothetical protein